VLYEDLAMSEDLHLTIISTNTRVKGELHLAEHTRIAGTVEGLVATAEPLELTASGTIIGDVRGATFDIHGTLRGTITLSQACRLGPTARVTADLRASSLSIAEGAQFQGNVSIGAPLPADDAEPAAEQTVEQLAAEAARIAEETGATANADLRAFTENVQGTVQPRSRRRG
jgi:cytoskeletal protein CcmA (bactofilin family)